MRTVRRSIVLKSVDELHDAFKLESLDKVDHVLIPPEVRLAGPI